MTNPYNHPIAALKKRLDNIETKLSPDYANGKPLQLVENLVQEIKEDCYIKGGIIDIKNNRSECSFNLGLCNMDGQVQEDLFTFDRAPMTAAGGGGLVRVIVETSLIKKGSYVKLYALAGLSDISIKVYPATGGITNV